MKENHLSMVGTFSKHPRAWGFRDDTEVVDATGALLDLGDDRWYLDWVCGLGSNLLGYDYGPVVQAVSDQIKHGVGFSLPHRLEREVANKLAFVVGSRIPGFTYENTYVRFAKTGSDATSMAVRLARAITGKDMILHCGYSGWGSEFIAASPPAHGITVDQKRIIQTFSFGAANDLAGKLARGQVAAVIMEQGIVDPPEGYYNEVRRLCDEAGALLIIDEVVTGLRYAVGGASEKYGIQPDLVVMGKALGNGFPISAVLGPKEYLDWFNRDDPVFCSSTHWGEAASLAAANVVLDVVSDSFVRDIYGVGYELIQEMRAAGWNIVGHPQRSLMVFEDDIERAFFVHGMKEQGILMNRPNFVSLAHTYREVVQTSTAAMKVRVLWDSVDKDHVAEMMPKNKIPHVLFKGR